MKQKEQEYAKKAFNKVADNYDEIPFFKISAKHVLETIKKHKNNEHIELLDVACGTGNVLLECASSMPNAKFTAVDISEGMLEKAKNNAKKRALENISFHLQDITKLTLTQKYDVITCSYALFFLPDAHKVLQTLVTLLNEDGMVIFTTFTPKAFKISNEILLPLLVQYGSKSAKEYDVNRWENLKQRKDIERLCELSNVELVEIESQNIRYGLSVDTWWKLMNDTGYKGMLMELSSENYALVKEAYYEAMLNCVDMNGEVELVADSWFVVVNVSAS